MIKKIFSFLNKNFLILFFLLIFLEIISFISLVSLVYISKININIPREYVLLFHHDLPHPIFKNISWKRNKLKDQERHFVPGKSLAHPNYGWYKSVD